MIEEIVYATGLLIVSAFFSGAEMAYVMSDVGRLEARARQRGGAAKSAVWFARIPDEFFSTILIANNLANVAFASVVAALAAFWLQWNEWSVLAATTLALLVVGELTPKYLAREIPNRFFLAVSVPLRIAYYILYPFVAVASALSRKTTASSTIEEETIARLLSRESFERIVAEDAAGEGRDDGEIIRKALSLKDQRVGEIMRPRTDVVAVDIDDPIEKVVDVFVESGYSKLPVYRGNLDDVVGVTLAYDLFKTPASLREVTREALFMPEARPCNDALEDFISHGATIAVVVDEFGGTAGIVTLEDIIEEMVGEIEDEYDVEEDVCRRIAENVYLVSGRVEIDDANERLGLDFPEGPYNTVGGFTVSAAGRIPKQGESLDVGEWRILVVRASATRVELIKVIRTLVATSHIV
jgi:CBS domain containing-hemolysin-like protein